MSKEKVVCKICGQIIKNNKFGYHLRMHKDISYEEYYDKYIDTSDHLCICGKKLKFYNTAKGYRKTCGNSMCIFELEKKIRFEKTGYENNFINPEKRQIAKQTNLERHGDENYNNRAQAKITKKERYDSENYNNQEKARQTRFERYNDENYGYFGSNRFKQILLEKYGDENYNGDSYCCGVGIKSQELFLELDKRLLEQNIKYDKIQYGYIENGKIIKKEKIVHVKDVSKNFKVRFLDCYVEINNRQIAIEFDESWHEKTIEKDIEREQEILTKKLNLEFYRVKEKYYDENLEQTIFDLIEIIKDKNAKTFYNYNSLIKLNTNII
jgi:hypothetical protein